MKKLIIFLIIGMTFSQIACVSKKVLVTSDKKVDTLTKEINALLKANTMLTLDYYKLKSEFLEHLKLDSNIANNSSDIIYLNNGLFSFPNPPPQPTCKYTFDSNVFAKYKNYNEVDKWIVNLLEKAGYKDKINYFLFDNGFVIATNIEQIYQDGKPKGISKRWLSDDSNNLSENFSIKAYVRKLFVAQPGYYRSFVFVASPSLNYFSQDDYSKELFSKYLSQGGMVLPERIGATSIPRGFKITVLVYEFKKLENSNQAILLTNSFSGEEHLKKSTILR